jgi:DNA-binding GntR family transcriptional regulator
LADVPARHLDDYIAHAVGARSFIASATELAFGMTAIIDDKPPGRANVASPRLLTDEAYFELKSQIMENRLPPGFQASETELAELLGISRTPVREAVIRLCEEGLVEVRRRRGIRVLAISVEDMREIYDLLTILESECARRLTKTGLSASEINLLEQSVDDMETALERGALGDWAKADDQFHRLHLAFLTNHRLAKMIGQLLDQAHRVRMFTLSLRVLPTQSTSDHRDMVAALQGGDPVNAARLYREHRMTAAIELFEILERHKLHYL